MRMHEGPASGRLSRFCGLPASATQLWHLCAPTVLGRTPTADRSWSPCRTIQSWKATPAPPMDRRTPDRVWGANRTGCAPPGHRPRSRPAGKRGPMLTDPDTLTELKTKAIKELRDEAARRPERFEHDAFAAMLREDDARRWAQARVRVPPRQHLRLSPPKVLPGSCRVRYQSQGGPPALSSCPTAARQG